MSDLEIEKSDGLWLSRNVATPQGTSEAIVLSKALQRVARKLGLATDVLATAIGVSAQEATAVFFDRVWLEPHSEAGLRALKIVRLFASLDILVGHDSECRRAWMNSRVFNLDGAPAELIQTTEGLDAVVAYLDGMRSR